MSHAELYTRLKELQKANSDLKKQNAWLRHQEKRASKLCTSLFHYTLPTNNFSDIDFNTEIPKELTHINLPTALIQTQPRRDEHKYNVRRERREEKRVNYDLDDDLEEEQEEEYEPRMSEDLAYGAALPSFKPRKSREYSDFNFWKESYPTISDLGNLDGSSIAEKDTIPKAAKPKFEKKERRGPQTRRHDWSARSTRASRYDQSYSPMRNTQHALCKFFAAGYGTCYQGANCRFLHTLSPSLSPMLPPGPFIEPPGMSNFSLERRNSGTLSPHPSLPAERVEKQKAINFWKDTAEKQLEQKQFDAAAHSFSQVLGLTYDVDAHWKRGLIYRLQGNYYHASRYPSLKQKAVTLHNKSGQDFSEVIKSSKSKYNVGFAYLCRADGFAKRGLWELAMGDVNEHLKRRKHEKTKKQEGIMAMLLNINGYALRGDIHVAMKEDHKATQDYKKAMQNDPTNREKYNQAIKSLRKVNSQ